MSVVSRNSYPKVHDVVSAVRRNSALMRSWGGVSNVSGARKTRSEIAALCSPSVTVHRGLCLYFIGSGHRSWLLPLYCTGFIVRELNTRGEHR